LTFDVDLDFLDRVQLINYVRTEVGEGRSLPKVWTLELFEDEQYLKPRMKDDAVLYSLDDVDESAFDTETALDSSEQEIQDLRERVAQLQIQFAAYREEVQVSFQKHVDKMKDPPADQLPDKPDPDTTTITNKQGLSSQEDQDSGYFNSYSYNTIHESMLKDTIRTDAYRDFIYDNKHLFANKTVLDVGCGTGILSLFCAKAGAKAVIAVDNSAIIDKARVIVYENGLQDVIRCLRGKIEEVKLPVDQVDVIISEWMGYGLLYESMLDSVLWARDAYLDRDHGLMVPAHATLRIAPLLDSDLRVSHVDFWRSVYGFDMSGMLDDVYDEALVRSIDRGDVAGGNSVPFLQLDLHTAQTTDLTFLHAFEIEWTGTAGQTLDGWAIWFDVLFFKSRSEKLGPTGADALASASDAAAAAAVAAVKGQNGFSTGPDAPQTHWQQVALLAKKQDQACKQGEVVRGKIGYQKREGRDRSIDIEVMWECGGEGKGKGEQRQVWTLD
jgi:type I protein arginine methyltransferase